MPSTEGGAGRWPPVSRPVIQAIVSDRKPRQRAGDDPHLSRSGSSAMPAVNPASAASRGSGRRSTIPAATPATAPDSACECPSISPAAGARLPVPFPPPSRAKLTNPGDPANEARRRGGKDAQETRLATAQETVLATSSRDRARG